MVTVATSCLMFVAACGTTDDPDTDDNKTSTKIDTQVLKNGNFEFFDDKDGNYYIANPENWSSSSTTTPDSMSGVIGTSYERWSAFTDPELPEKLWVNYNLESDDDDKVDYNGVMPVSLPFKNTHKAIKKSAVDRNDDKKLEDALSSDPEDIQYIDNPYTHAYRWVGEDELLDADGNKVTTYKDGDGNYFLDAELKQPLETSVLMVHNYREENNDGTQTSYTASTTLTLEENTAAKLSVWVKTSELYFERSNDERIEASGEHGAYIQINQTVGGTSLDPFYIKNIDTSKLNPYDAESGKWENGNNGWVEYTVYVRGCDYSPTTVTVTVGLGDADPYTCEGYAFFDDIAYEKYADFDALVEANGGNGFDGKVTETTSTLLGKGDDKIYSVGTPIFNDSEDGNDGVTIGKYADKHDYLIDLTSAIGRNYLDFTEANTQMGLTVDENNYVSSKNSVTPVGAALLDNGADNANLPVGLRENAYYTNGLDTKDDVLASLKVGSGENWTSGIGGNYGTIIDNALKSAGSLPDAQTDTATLLMLSAGKASYETVISDPSFSVGAGQYKIISFWVKTSDMSGKTPATFTVRDKDDHDTSSNFSVDSTTQTTVVINDNEMYDGWTQCYILVANEFDDEAETKQFEIVFNFGLTTIKGTTSSSYKAGWAAMTNMSVLEVDEDVFKLANSDTRSATLTYSEQASGKGNVFDSQFGNGNEIQTGIVRPSSYNGVNGGSSSVTNTQTEITPYDYTNDNLYAGLISKEYYENYKDEYANKTDISSALKALFSETGWNDLVKSSTTTQPLLIFNAAREIADKASAIYNYGYIGKDASASSGAYTAISTRVFVHGGAIAKVYLVDTTTKQILNYSLPEYTFWYDEDGNVLFNEPDENADSATQKKNIAYRLTSNGLYEDADGNKFANIYNLTRKYFDETVPYYDADGNEVSFESLESGKIYYADTAKTAYASHYLIAEDGTLVFSYAKGTGSDAEYYYMVDVTKDDKTVRTADTSATVKGFKVADNGSTDGVQLRYDNRDGKYDSPYMFTIDAIHNPELADQWFTVTFFIHTGSNSKDYRLELWSGERDKEVTEDVQEDSYVLFDYNSISLDETTYNTLLNKYKNDIVNDYVETILAKDANTKFDEASDNLNYLEELAGKKSGLYNYDATYYTFTLYDTANYVPFNEDTADADETGYDYNYSDYSEALSYLRIEDLDNNNLNMFVDYSTMEQTIPLGTAPDVDEDEDTPEDTDNGLNVWLLASSIALVAAILIVLAFMAIKTLTKNRKHKKTSSKNSYNYNRNKRYVKTYVKANGEAPVAGGKKEESAPAQPVTEEAVENNPAVETPAVETPAEVPTETATEATPEASDNSPATDEDKKDD